MAMHLMNSWAIALVRGVPRTFAKAIGGGGTINTDIAMRQKDEYVAALSKIVDIVEQIPGDDRYPDCSFVEDTVVYARGVAVTLRPGHESRRGEVTAVRETLRKLPSLQCVKTIDMEAPGALCDGGDVLFTGGHMFVGLSGRTNEAGAAALADVFGASLPVVPVPVSGALHLKSLVTLLRPGVLLYANNDAGREVVARMAAGVGSRSYRAIGVPDQASANVVSVIQKGEWRGTLIRKGRCEESRRLIRGCFGQQEQARVLEVDISEVCKPDAALSCCSVLLEGQPA